MKYKLKKSVLVILILLIIGIISIISVHLFKSDFKINNFETEVSYNYLESFDYNPGSICYGNFFTCHDVEIFYDNDIDVNKIGVSKIKYTYKYKTKELTLEQKIKIVDNESPIIEVKNDEVYVCPNGKIINLDLSAIDDYDGDITEKIEKSIDNNKLILKITDFSGNKTTKNIDVIIKDDEAPKITLNGSKVKNISLGKKYTDEGASVVDNCDDDIKLKVENNINYDKAGTYYITYSATDSSGNKSEVKRTVNLKSVSGNKIIYLTFDDGPSAYTNELLDILKKYNIKVTFFVTGKGDDSVILREYNEGHTIALHTYTHSYATVYSSVDAYFDDLYAVRDRVKRITGVDANLIRFPGGSSNTVSKRYDGGIKIMSYLSKEVVSRGFTYFDWNVSSGDGGGTTSTDQVFLNVTNNLKSGSSVVLQHDTQKFSIDAVERIINYGLENGYIFKALDETSPTAHHGIAN